MFVWFLVFLIVIYVIKLYKMFHTNHRLLSWLLGLLLQSYLPPTSQ